MSDATNVQPTDTTTMDPTTTPAPTTVTPPAADPATTLPATEQETTYSAADVEALKKQWAQDTEKAAQEAAARAEELAKLGEAEREKKLREESEAELSRLKAQIADKELTEYTRTKVDGAALPASAVDFIKGKDEADTDQRIKAFGEMFTAAVQEGVEARFKENGYTPRRSGGDVTPETNYQRRGVERVTSK